MIWGFLLCVCNPDMPGSSCIYTCPCSFQYLTYTKLFIFIFCPCWVSVAVCRLSLVAPSRGYSLVTVLGLLIAGLLLLWSTGSRGPGLQYSWLEDSRAWVQELEHTGLDAPGHVRSSCTRYLICLLCFGRQIPSHWTTREVHAKFNSRPFLTAHLSTPLPNFQHVVKVLKMLYGNLKEETKEGHSTKYFASSLYLKLISTWQWPRLSFLITPLPLTSHLVTVDHKLLTLFPLLYFKFPK